MAYVEPTTRIEGDIPPIIRPGRPPKDAIRPTGQTNGHVQQSFKLPTGQVINLTINTSNKVVIVLGNSESTGI